MTRSELVKMVQSELGDVPIGTVKKIVDTFLHSIAASLRRGDTIRIAGFGNFCTVQRRQRMGRNPRTGASAIIPPHKGVRFIVSRALKNSVNQ